MYTYGSYSPDNGNSLVRPNLDRNASVDSVILSSASDRDQNDSPPPVEYLKDRLVARAVALLNKTNSAAGTNRRLLNDNVTIPIQSKYGMDLVGTISFEYSIVTPFSHPKWVCMLLTLIGSL